MDNWICYGVIRDTQARITAYQVSTSFGIVLTLSSAQVRSVLQQGQRIDGLRLSGDGRVEVFSGASQDEHSRGLITYITPEAVPRRERMEYRWVEVSRLLEEYLLGKLAEGFGVANVLLKACANYDPFCNWERKLQILGPKQRGKFWVTMQIRKGVGMMNENSIIIRLELGDMVSTYRTCTVVAPVKWDMADQSTVHAARKAIDVFIKLAGKQVTRISREK